MKQDLANVQPAPDSTRRGLLSLRDDTRGAGLVEYIILVGLIALAAIMGFQTLGGSINGRAEGLGSQIDGIGQ
jgi:pilus assembly protein Flp/PilA